MGNIFPHRVLTKFETRISTVAIRLMGALLFAAGASQVAAQCTFTTMPSSRVQGYGNNTNYINVNTGAGCAWNAVNTNSWITILSDPNSTGPGMMAYAVAWNTRPEPRSGAIVIGGRAVMITQTGNPARVDVLGQTNGALTLNLQGEPTKMYVLQYTEDFATWTPVSTNPAQSIVTNMPDGDHRVYRTLKLP